MTAIRLHNDGVSYRHPLTVSFVVTISDDSDTGGHCGAWEVTAVVDSRDPLSWLATSVVRDGTLLDADVLNLIPMQELNDLVEEALIDHDVSRSEYAADARSGR